MYLECCKGKLNAEWKIEKPLDFWHFREKLSEQMLGYNPANRVYPGDQNMRVSTKQSTRDRHNASSTGAHVDAGALLVVLVPRKLPLEE
jgi:hypothetical protein